MLWARRVGIMVVALRVHPCEVAHPAMYLVQAFGHNMHILLILEDTSLGTSVSRQSCEGGSLGWSRAGHSQKGLSCGVEVYKPRSLHLISHFAWRSLWQILDPSELMVQRGGAVTIPISSMSLISSKDIGSRVWTRLGEMDLAYEL